MKPKKSAILLAFMMTILLFYNVEPQLHVREDPPNPIIVTP
ncbi:hypothetical protein [Fictibacillus halophilus]|nr:hypothetical protein [Fictibacillus halophilus]